jgi:type I restriction enzyme R subunit
LTDNTKLVLRPFKKLNNAISERFSGKIEAYDIRNVYFLMNATVHNLRNTRPLPNFEKSQLIGFTGTPILPNASKNDLGKRTTKDLFGNCLHKYVITDAIRDQNVLRFGIEYVGK